VCSQQTLSATGLHYKLTLQKAASRRKLQGAFCNLYNNPLLIEPFYLALHEDEIAELRKSWELPSSMLDNPIHHGDSDIKDDNLLHIGDVLDGSVLLQSSNAGGEFFQILEDDNLQYERRLVALFFAFGMSLTNSRQNRKETRTRRDRTNQRTEGFRRQMPAIVDAYLLWKESSDAGSPRPPESTPTGLEDGAIHLQVIDAFGEYFLFFSCLHLLHLQPVN